VIKPLALRKPAVLPQTRGPDVDTSSGIFHSSENHLLKFDYSNTAKCSNGNRAVSPGLKRTECAPDHTRRSSVEVKNSWSYTSTPPYVFMTWCLAKYTMSFHTVVLSKA